MPTFDSFNPDHVPPAKLAVHSLQAVLTFVAFCLEIAVMVNKEASITGGMGWAMAVFWLSIPAWVYNIMTPRFERTRRLADPRAMLTIDVLFFVIWISAFSAQAASNSWGKCGTACGQSKAIVGIGVIVALLWIAATFISFFTLQHWNIQGSLPGYDKRRLPANNIDPDKAAFSMAPHDEEGGYAAINMDERDPGRNDEYASGAYGGTAYTSNDPYDESDAPHHHNPYEPNTGSVSSRPSGYDHQDTAYGGSSNLGGGSGSGGGYVPPTVAETYHDDGPVSFPAANYDRVR